MSTIVVATANTSNFEFQTYATDRAAAERQLIEAWREHVRQTGADPALMREMLEWGDVNFTELRVGQTTRDGEVLR